MSQVSPSTTAPVKGKEESEKAQKPSNDSVVPTVASQGETSKLPRSWDVLEKG